jgi:hypothetical protein
VTRERVRYVDLGIWPYFVGFTLSEAAFQREMRRLKIDRAIEWVTAGGSNATTHHFSREGNNLSILCFQPPRRRFSKEQFAAMVAHEALHAVQEMRDCLGDLGREAEAYTLQTIVQDVLQVAWSTGRLRRLSPRPF